MNPTTPTSNIGTGAAWKLAAHPWALHPSGFARVEDMATALAAAKGGRPTTRAALKADMAPGGIAKVRIYGVLAKDDSWWPDTAYDEIVAIADALRSDKSVRGVFLDFDSPGGSTLGALEAAEALQALSKDKRDATIAYTDQIMASAAYFLAASAGTIMSARTAYTGSIGAFTFFADWSGFLDQVGIKVEVFHNTGGDLKTTWLPWSSLTDEQRAHLQEHIDKAYGHFSGFVDANRPMLADGSKRGQVFLGDEAQERGVIDGTGSRADAMAWLERQVG